VLAAADVHVVPLKAGLARSSVPSKLYSILAAGRPLVASVDLGTEVARTVEQAGAGLAVPPDDPEAFTKAVVRLVQAPEEAAAMGAAGRRFVEGWASPAAVAGAYEDLFAELASWYRTDPVAK
jgi:colanic acid biosynthesis glycosyl transferase WcaI